LPLRRARLAGSRSGDDQLFGGSGADTLNGSAGSDFLYGGPRGSGDLDVLTGGPGADVFLLSYSQETSNSGAGFWSQFFAKMGQDIASNEAKTAIAEAIKASAEGITAGFLAAGLGAAGGDLAAAFVGMVESLFSSGQPRSKQDVMVVTDFDPREDVLILPLATSESLTESVVFASEIPGGGGGGNANDWVLQFAAGGSTVYAYVELSADFLDDMGIQAFDPEAKQILNDLLSFSSTIVAQSGTVGFSNLVAPSVIELPDGGFQPPAGTVPAGSSVALFGAIGGMIGGPSGTSTLASTNYADAVTTNSILLDPSRIPSSEFTWGATAATIHGFGGDDLLYGTDKADSLFGDDGNDTLYSFVSTVNSGGGIDAESLSGGTGDDTLYGGGSAGAFDGGDGSDTFAVFYLPNNPVLQLEVDLTAGYAAERKAPSNTSAPVGDTAPFPGAGSDKVPNNYTLTGIENAIGGPLNDWIKAASGSLIEGGAGADYLLAKGANSVTLSYAGSSAGVSVQLDADNAVASGGDAAGDELGYDNVDRLTALIGSANDDTLGAFSPYQFTNNPNDSLFKLTGNGGSDTFQFLGINGTGLYAITDFAKGDIIDLRPLGTTSFADVGQDGGGFSLGPDGQVCVYCFLERFAGQLSASDFKFATSVSGAASARPGGDGLVGSEGADTLLGSAGDDFLFGKGGEDVLAGGAGNDALDGGDGADAVSGGAGQDRLKGGAGDDTLDGGAGDDVLDGADGDDQVWGGAGMDRLRGGAGDDRLEGGAGDDELDGGAGADQLRGGAGSDTFLLRFGELSGDRVIDFSRLAGDRLVIVANRPVTVEEQGQGTFVVTDGTVTETLTAIGAAESDFLI
jgi:hypothetical protein